jgi:hypothetical protein
MKDAEGHAGMPEKPVNLLSASRWLELAAEVRQVAETARSPEARSALRELALSYIANAAGLDALDYARAQLPAHPTGRRNGA